MSALPETILQFGSGRFLRAFADLFVHHGNEQGQNVGRIVVVQSTGDARADALTRQGGKYHVVVRGLENGQVVDRVEECASISRALHAGSHWDEVLAVARSPELQTVISNTTEAGYEIWDDDPTASPPESFPGKLWAVLHARWLAGQPGVTIIPCELIEGNAGLLRQKILHLADLWDAAPEFRRFLTERCVWLHTLVDRIVTGAPQEHPLLAADQLLITAEPFAFWALEDDPRSRFTLKHPAITRAKDVQPYFLRKVRILNAAHTALLIKARPRGFAIVRDAVNDPKLGAWLWRLLSEEIVPTLEGRVDQPLRFAEQTIERFRNPFLEHKFADIALHHESKMRVRLLPTRDEFAARFGKQPPLLEEVIEEGFEQLKIGQ
jgi:tagaturonate reductase